jgi:hypothetical protein
MIEEILVGFKARPVKIPSITLEEKRESDVKTVIANGPPRPVLEDVTYGNDP